MGNHLLGRAGWAALLLLGLCLGPARADFETELLQKFKQQNQQNALQVSEVVENNLARARVLSPQEPAKALELLRQSRALLDAAQQLSRTERADLMRKLDDGFRDAKARLESQEAFRNMTATPKPPKSTPMVPDFAAAKDRKVLGNPILFQPNIIAAPSQASMQVTPVVSADRRWVRINVSGALGIISLGR